ncbi:sensor histidine kinase [Sulfurimonas sp. HSL-1656]|uniref:sensor histidine kinase n=1 Tax=Thiomicrolovo subterrani TaxID=3131934 RepID=UPI0031F9494D
MIRTIIIVLLLSLHAVAGTVMLDPSDRGAINIVPHSAYLMEDKAPLTPGTIPEWMPRFRAAEATIYNFGFVDKPIWIRFELSRPAGDRTEWILSIGNSHIDEYSLYRLEGEGLRLLSRDGDTVNAPRIYASRMFWEKLPPAEGTATYLLQVKTQGALQIPLTVERLSEAYREESFSNLLLGLFYGVMLLLLVYNMVLYIFVREIHYFNYLAFLASYMLFQLNFDGLGPEWLWPGNVWMANSGLAFFIFFSAMFGFRFARYFLMLKRHAPQAERVIAFAEFISFLGVLSVLLLDYHTAITAAAVWSAIIPWVLIYAGIKVLPNYHAARYYLAGWIVFLLATILVALNQLGVVPTHPVMLYTQQAGSLIQMILLSFALADRINMMKHEHMAKLREFNDELQVKIALKVDELREKDRIMILQSRQAAMGEMIENIAHQWRQPLNQLSLIQSNIFFEYQLGNLSEAKMQTYQEQSETLMEYMTHTIDDFRTFFMPDREREEFCICGAIEKVLELFRPTLNRYNIGIDLKCEGRPVTLGHENEFSQVMLNLLNNAKDAMLDHGTKKPQVTIRVQTAREMIMVAVCDNGGGVADDIIDRVFDPYFTTKFKSQGTGIGLYMVKTIMEKSMNGSVSVHNRGAGACFMLDLPRKDSDAT